MHDINFAVSYMNFFLFYKSNKHTHGTSHRAQFGENDKLLCPMDGWEERAVAGVEEMTVSGTLIEMCVDFESHISICRVRAFLTQASSRLKSTGVRICEKHREHISSHNVLNSQSHNWMLIDIKWVKVSIGKFFGFLAVSSKFASSTQKVHWAHEAAEQRRRFKGVKWWEFINLVSITCRESSFGCIERRCLTFYQLAHSHHMEKKVCKEIPFISNSEFPFLRMRILRWRVWVGREFHSDTWWTFQIEKNFQLLWNYKWDNRI